jgi:hypothetical protein
MDKENAGDQQDAHQIDTGGYIWIDSQTSHPFWAVPPATTVSIRADLSPQSPKKDRAEFGTKCGGAAKKELVAECEGHEEAPLRRPAAAPWAYDFQGFTACWSQDNAAPQQHKKIFLQ